MKQKKTESKPLPSSITTQRVIIVGRPNVGKSTLFNRLVGKRLALVHDQPGMTRDWREAQARLSDLSFSLIDTAGLADFKTAELDSQLADRIVAQNASIISKADLLLFVVDAQQGCTPCDEEIAIQLRSTYNIPTLLLVNKCEGNRALQSVFDFSTLAFDPIIPISAEHGTGLTELYDALSTYIAPEHLSFPGENASEEENPLRPLKLAIVGRPNAGKSTLINRLVGETRLLSGDLPGMTRDSITIPWTYKNQSIQLIDTAGLRRRARIGQSVEKLAVMDTHRVIRFSEVVILLVDATCPFEKQDLTIAQNIISEGRCLILAINKMDLCNDPKSVLDKITYRLQHALAQVPGIPIIGISAEKDKNFDPLMKAALSLYKTWNQRLPTGQLNRWLETVLMHNPPPAAQGRRIRIKYISQVRTRPPTFALFASKATRLPESYRRYLINSLRQDFDLPGVPIRLSFRSGKNPYV